MAEWLLIIVLANQMNIVITVAAILVSDCHHDDSTTLHTVAADIIDFTL